MSAGRQLPAGHGAVARRTTVLETLVRSRLLLGALAVRLNLRRLAPSALRSPAELDRIRTVAAGDDKLPVDEHQRTGPAARRARVPVDQSDLRSPEGCIGASALHIRVETRIERVEELDVILLALRDLIERRLHGRGETEIADSGKVPDEPVTDQASKGSDDEHARVEKGVRAVDERPQRVGVGGRSTDPLGFKLRNQRCFRETGRWLGPAFRQLHIRGAFGNRPGRADVDRRNDRRIVRRRLRRKHPVVARTDEDAPLGDERIAGGRSHRPGNALDERRMHLRREQPSADEIVQTRLKRVLNSQVGRRGRRIRAC